MAKITHFEKSDNQNQLFTTRIVIECFVTTVEYDYPTFHLTMHCFICHLQSGLLKLKEHEAARWLTQDQLDTVQWLPADLSILDLL